MKKVIIILVIFLLAGVLSYYIYNKMNNSTIYLNNTDIEINTEHKISEFVKQINNGELLNGNDSVLFDTIGKKEIKIIYNNKLKKEKSYIFYVEVKDTISPEIVAKDSITITLGDKIDLLKDVKVEDNSNEDITPTIEGEYDLKKIGTYKLKYKATDSSNNTTYKDFELIVKEKKVVTNTGTNSKYYIKINKTLNVVMIYSQDGNGEYTKLVKTFVCSAGNNTPTGVFKTDAKAETLYLEGGVYGHYTVRFLKSRGMWFHSVPYFSKPKDGHWNDLEYEEYNKLGTLASKGCVRLAVADAKWIYNNIANGTTVEIYESDSLPEGVTKPTAIKIDVNSENRGWDPTDPDLENPWKK